MIRKISIFLFFVLLFVVFLPSLAFGKEGNSDNSQFLTPNLNSDVPKNLNTYSQSVVISLLSSFSCLVAGIDPLSKDNNCLALDNNTGKLGISGFGKTDGFVQNGGAIGFMGTLISSTFNIPVSSSQYISYLGQNFGFAKSAYAQGTGFNQLRPLMNLWKQARNMVYLLFVLIFILVGLGIMFRIKLDPRTVMTIQNQIPKIITTLIFITFSYAIAGFLIDMMWVLIYFFYIIFEKSGSVLGSISPSSIYGASPFGVIDGLGGIGGLTSKASGQIGDIIASSFNIGGPGPGRWFAALIIGLLGGLIGGAIGGVIPLVGKLGWLAGAGAGASLGAINLSGFGTILAFIIIFIAVLWSLFRLWFQLIYTFILILIDVIAAPFWIGIGLLPGVQVGFGHWIRELIANLMVYPTTFVMFLLGKVLMDIFSDSAKNAGAFIPPLVGNINVGEGFGALIGLGVVFSLPSVVEIVRSALKTPPIKIPPSIGQAVSFGSAVPSRAIGGSASTVFAPIYPGVKQPGGALGKILRGFGWVR